jgi:muconolactone delta-isomerase
VLRRSEVLFPSSLASRSLRQAISIYNVELWVTCAVHGICKHPSSSICLSDPGRRIALS